VKNLWTSNIFLGVASVAFVIGCKSNDSDHASAQRKSYAVRDVTILPVEVAAQSGLVQEFTPLWDPSTNLVSEAVSRLPHVLKVRQWLSSPAAEVLPKSHCQAVGVTHGGSHAILLNFFPASVARDGWRNHYIRIHDSQNNWWVFYLPETGKFTDWHGEGGIP
jgi:hypothetical protein